jgi:hypothetical protein
MTLLNKLPYLNKLKFNLGNELYRNVGNYSKVLGIFDPYNETKHISYICREVRETVKNGYRND